MFHFILAYILLEHIEQDISLKMRKSILLLLAVGAFACSTPTTESTTDTSTPSTPDPTPVKTFDAISITLEQAENLATLPLSCVQTEYPNKLGQTIGSAKDLGEPSELHPAFYGCFDWHSAVHGHWSMVKLLKLFPDMKQAEEMKEKLTQNLSKANIRAEIEYFNGEFNKTYERTYGWAWLLKLYEELHTWEDPFARELEFNLKPLADLIASKYIDYLPKLRYPIRVGEHTNSAFGMSFAWDYAEEMQAEYLKNAIAAKAKEFFTDDQNCPFDWEPSGYDFLSPCFEEIDIMRKVLTKEEFDQWISKFSPQLKRGDYNIAVGEVSDRTDGKMVHLDGLNFSRAWVMYGLANQYPEYSHLVGLANKHVEYSLPNLVGDSYEGGHWLGSFAIYALYQNTKPVENE